MIPTTDSHEPPATETFRAGAERILEQLATDPRRANYGKEGPTIAGERLARLRRWAFDAIGDTPIDKLTGADVAGVLTRAARNGLSEPDLVHLRNDLGAVLGELELLPDSTLLEAVDLMALAQEAFADGVPVEAIETAIEAATSLLHEDGA